MSQFVPISFERHAGKRWQRFTSYQFAHQTAILPLTGAELPKAVMALPIAFIRDDADRYTPAAVLSLTPGDNLFVAPDGRWLGRYIPAALRGHPFRLASVANDKWALCIDEDSELIQTSEGELFFTDDGQVAPAIQSVMDFLRQLELNRQATITATTALAQHQLIQPWPITLDQGTAGTRQVDGLYRLNEAAFNQSSGEILSALHPLGAVTIAYCQLLSMQHLPMLSELATARTKMKPAAPVSLAFNDDDLLHFD